MSHHPMWVHSEITQDFLYWRTALRAGLASLSYITTNRDLERIENVFNDMKKMFMTKH